MQLLQKYENVEKRFGNVGSVRGYFSKTFQKRFGNVVQFERSFCNVSRNVSETLAFQIVFFATFPETFWKRSVRFFAPWKENVLKTKKNAGNVFAGGRTDKNEKKTRKKRNGNVRGVFKGLSLFFVRGLLFVRSV